MNKITISRYKTALQAKQKELSACLRNRDDIAIEKTPDALDEVQLARDRELAISNLNRESNVLRDIRTALERIENGDFGTCLKCEEEITSKRLDAIPWAKFCVNCHDTAANSVQQEGGEDGQQHLQKEGRVIARTNTARRKKIRVTHKPPDLMSNIRAGMPSAPSVFDWIAIRQTK